MVTAQVQKYRDASKALLDLGFSELGQGDTRQASERGWEATVLMLKAVAEQRGWEHQGCRPIRRVASRLADETGDAEIRQLYRVAHSLHTNFYEDLDTAEDVGAGLDDVQRLLDKLALLLAAPEAARSRPHESAFYRHPTSRVVHREGYCGDVKRHYGAWVSLGHFSSVGEAIASKGGDACLNCFPCKRGDANRPPSPAGS